MGLALALLCGFAGGCEKGKDGGPSTNPDADADAKSSASGPEVIVEDPGAKPEVVVPEKPAEEEQPEAAQPPAGAGGTEIVATQVPCSSDADCVKDSCCHATSCVAAADAPDCKDTMCTMDCRANTMDCYGGCLCQDGVCAAEIWLGPPQSP